MLLSVAAVFAVLQDCFSMPSVILSSNTIAKGGHVCFIKACGWTNTDILNCIFILSGGWTYQNVYCLVLMWADVVCYFKIDLMAFQRSNNHVCLNGGRLDIVKEGIITCVPLYLACIFSSSPVASTDHVCCDVSVKGLAAVTPHTWYNGHCDRPQGEGGLTPTQTVVAPPRHPTHQAFDHSCPLLGQRCQRHIFIQHQRHSQLNRKPKKKKKGYTELLICIYISITGQRQRVL